MRGLLSDAIGYLDDAVSAMSEITTDAAEIAAILSDFLKDAAPKAHDDIQRALDALGSTSDSLNSAMRRTRRLIEGQLNARDDLTFYPLGDGYQDTLDSLFTNLRSTMDELDALSDGLSADGSTLTADLRAVNDQMNAVVNLCLDIFVDMTDADASDIFEDTSDENIDAVTFGKVRSCTNYGAVDADLNVGGIAGAMAIEYELGPEGDQKESSSVFDRVYETKAVVQHCVNRGSISGKKDCIGGIVGEMAPRHRALLRSLRQRKKRRPAAMSAASRDCPPPASAPAGQSSRFPARAAWAASSAPAARAGLLVSRLRLHGDRLPQPRCR